MPSAGSPESQRQSDWTSRGREFCRSAVAVHSAGSPRSRDRIEAAGAERLAGGLAQCTALAHLNLSFYGIGTALLALLCSLPSVYQTGNRKERHIVTIQRRSLRACTLALSYTSLNKRHDLYLIALLWVVATQLRASLTIFELSSVTSSWSESSLKCSEQRCWERVTGRGRYRTRHGLKKTIKHTLLALVTSVRALVSSR